MSAEETANERIEKKLDRIETALHGTGNPHGGLFQQFSVLEGKVSTLSSEIKGVEKTLIEKIDGVESKLEAKIDGVEKNFDKMFSFAKWVVGGLVGTVVIFAVPIFVEIVLPIIRKWMGFSVIAIAMIWTDTTAQAQLYIDVYPSQDNPESQTIWHFRHGGTSQVNYSSTFRSSGNFHRRDSWKMGVRTPTSLSSETNFYTANKPTNQLVSLSPLFSSANTKDIDSVRTRLQGSTGSYSSFSTNSIWFQSNATNAATIDIQGQGGGSRTIANIFMNDADVDEIGIRITPPNLAYTNNGQYSRWFGTGILNKPIGDFLSPANRLVVTGNDPGYLACLRWALCLSAVVSKRKSPDWSDE